MSKNKAFNLHNETLREINQYLSQEFSPSDNVNVDILNVKGEHALAVGMSSQIQVNIQGHTGYYTAGMNKNAHIHVHGNVGTGLGENIMSGKIIVNGFASACLGASGHGGTIIVNGDASARCGISLKGTDIIIKGSVGHSSAFMAQKGNLVICGDADHSLGDSLYEAKIYVLGTLHGLGADAIEKEKNIEDIEVIEKLLEEAQFNFSAQKFKKIESARQLYHWNSDIDQEY